MGSCGWVNTSGIRGEAAVEAVATAVWFIGCRKSIKSYWDRLFLFSYIYRVRKVVSYKEEIKN